MIKRWLPLLLVNRWYAKIYYWICQSVFRWKWCTLAAYLNMLKAFDWICHTRFVHKRKCYGDCCRIFKLIQSSLKFRVMKIRLDGRVSRPFHSNPGVSESSVLRHTLFIYIHERVFQCCHISNRYLFWWHSYLFVY